MIRIVRRLARQHLVQQHTQRVNVGTEIYLFARLAVNLLRAHVGHRSHASAGTGVATRFRVFRYTEIHDLDTVSPRHQDIGWLDVAMDNLVVVHVCKSLQQLAEEHLRLLFRNRAAMMRDVLLKIHPVNVLLHQHQLLRVVVNQDHNVGVIKLCQRLRLNKKKVANLVVLCKMRMQNLDGHPLTGRRVHPKVNPAHPPFAKQTLYAILQYKLLFHRLCAGQFWCREVSIGRTVTRWLLCATRCIITLCRIIIFWCNVVAFY